MDKKELFLLADRHGFNIEETEDGLFSLGTMDDDEDQGVTFDWLVEGLDADEVVEFIKENK